MLGVSLCGVTLEWRCSARDQSLTAPELTVERLRAFDDVFLALAVLSAPAMAAAWRMRQK